MADDPLPSPLMHPFRVIAFDWDGTADVGRRADTRAMRGPIERLLEVGVIVFIVTGTSFGNVEPQISAPIRGPHKTSLFFSTNGGSEIWGFDAESHHALVDRDDLDAGPDVGEEEFLVRAAGQDEHDGFLSGVLVRPAFPDEAGSLPAPPDVRGAHPCTDGNGSVRRGAGGRRALGGCWRTGRASMLGGEVGGASVLTRSRLNLQERGRGGQEIFHTFF